MSSQESAVRASSALLAASLVAVSLLAACASPGPPQPEVPATARQDPYVVSPVTGYALAGAGDVEQRIERAFAALSAGRELTEVAAAGREALQEVPDYRPAAVLLAQVAYLRQEDAAAIDRLDPWVGELPDYTAAQLLLGRLAERTGDVPAALEAFSRVAGSVEQAAERAAQIRPRAVEIVFRRLREEIDRGRVEKAESHLAWLGEWAEESRETLEGTRLVAV